MKRTLWLLVVLITATSLSAAETKTRYLIATRRPVIASQLRMVRDGEMIVKHNVRSFRNFNAFAADLTAEEAAVLRKSPEVRYLAPVVERSISSDAPPASDAAGRYGRQQTIPYGIDLIGARQLWPYTRGGGSVVNVVVADTGIDYTHPELKDRYLGGYNVFNKSDDPMDDHGHGTHVAGTIAAVDNELGVVGVAPSVRLWSVKVLRENGSGTDENIIDGMDWVIAKKREIGGNWIVNLSLGSQQGSDVEKEAFIRVIAEGILVAAAAGNRGRGQLDAPALYSGVLAISAIDSGNTLAEFSSFGAGTAFAAPGVAVLSTVPVGTATAVDIVTETGRAFDAIPLVGSPRGEITGETVFCGHGAPSEFPATVAGRIAVIKRSTAQADCDAKPEQVGCPPIRFKEKVLNAVAAGAIGVIIVPNDSRGDNGAWTLIPPGEEEDDRPFPVTVSVVPADAPKVLDLVGKEPLTASFRFEDFAFFNGTSMATPHVAGAAALVWSLAPTATADQVRLTLKLTAFDLGAKGYDDRFGYGRINPLAAAQYIAPAILGVQPPPAPDPRRRQGH